MNITTVTEAWHIRRIAQIVSLYGVSLDEKPAFARTLYVITRCRSPSIKKDIGGKSPSFGG